MNQSSFMANVSSPCYVTGRDSELGFLAIPKLLTTEMPTKESLNDLY